MTPARGRASRSRGPRSGKDRPGARKPIFQQFYAKCHEEAVKVENKVRRELGRPEIVAAYGSSAAEWTTVLKNSAREVLRVDERSRIVSVVVE